MGLRAGQVDCCVHGSAPREVRTGQRRFVLYRYGPSWANSRYGYPPSVELLRRLTPERRKIMYHPLLPRHHNHPLSTLGSICRLDADRFFRARRQPIAPLLPPGEEQVLSEATGAVSQGNGFGRLPTSVRDAAFDSQLASTAKL